MGRYRGRMFRPFRLIVQLLSLGFLLGGLYGIPYFGSYPFLRRILLPNASCRYIDSAPTSCFYYQLQDGLTSGSAELYLNVVLMLLVVVLLILLLGRLWCSWLCPFGLFQEGLTALRRLFRIPPLRLKWSQRVLLRRTKYAIILLTILISLPIGIAALGVGGCQSTLALPFCQICPAKGFFTLSQQILGLQPWSTELPILAIASLATFSIWSFFVDMGFCRVCPMGGFMALFSKQSMVWLRKDPNKCTKCRICLRVCPVEHDKVYEDMESVDVGGEDCTLCGRCIEFCPENDCLSLNVGPKRIISSRKPRISIFGRRRDSRKKGG